MLTHFERPGESRELFFKLSDSLHITNFDDRSDTSKFAGLYSLYKNGNCMYVGQSQNLASRIAQHLTGKYESVDKVVIFMAAANGFDDFYNRSKESRKTILENNEKVLIKQLKPIENLNLPCDNFDIREDKKFHMFNEVNVESGETLEETYGSAFITLDRHYLLVSDCSDISGGISEGLFTQYNKWVIDLYESYGSDAFGKGLL